MPLSNDQQEGLELVLKFMKDPMHNEMVLTGGPGVGKTYLTKEIIEIISRNASTHYSTFCDWTGELNLYLTSTTNKAAKVLSDATGMAAGTIHSLLGLIVFNDYETGKAVLKRGKKTVVIQNSVILIDEISMANKSLIRMIRAQTHNCKIIYIGDKYQLAPVKEKPTSVFEDTAVSIELEEIQRQAADNSIISYSALFKHALITGEFPKVETHGANVICLDPDPFTNKLIEAFTSEHVPNEYRVLAWTNGRVHEYNSYIRGLICESSNYEVGEYLLTNQPILDPDNKVVYSTDSIAKITDIETGSKDDINGWYITLDSVIVVFQAYNQLEVTNLIKRLKKAAKTPEGSWVPYFIAKEAYADLRPVHCSTVNKAQGSTFKNVFLDVSDIGRCTQNEDIARLMYTGITRASDTVYMCGNLPNRLYR